VVSHEAGSLEIRVRFSAGPLLKMKETKIVKALVVNNGALLLLKKIGGDMNAHRGCWEAPGGKVENNADPEGELMRELREEIGMEGEIKRNLAPWTWEHKGKIKNCSVYLVEVKNREVILSHEHSDFIWINPNEMEKMEKIVFKERFVEYLKEAGLI
jgi:8-oxo-dGTP diphosphatase